MDNLRQKVVSAIALIGILLFFTRCGNDTKQDVGEVISHEDTTHTVQAENKKTLFVKAV